MVALNGKRVAVALLTITALPSHAVAQELSGDEASFDLDPIVITATKRSVDLQKIIGSGVAVTGQDIQERNLTSSEELFNAVPGLQMQDYGGFKAQPTVMIRGVGTDRPEYENSVQINQDGLALSDSIMANFPLFDIEQVEVLRGPQSTLYGKNAEGGMVNIISRRPDNEFEGRTMVEGTTFRGGSIEQVLSGALIEDKVLSRLSFKYEDEQGDKKNPFDGKRIDGTKNIAGRLVNVFHITDNLTADLQLQASRYEDNGMEAYTFLNGSNNKPTLNSSNNLYITETDAQAAILNISYDMETMELTSISTFSHADSLGKGLSPFTLNGTQENDREFTGWSQEVRLASVGENKLDWLVGVFGFTGKREEGFELLTSVQLDLETELERRSLALFGEATWNVSDRLHLTGGARLAWDEAEITGDDVANVPFPPFGTFSTRGQYNDKTSDITVSPKIGLSYDLTDSNSIYGLVSHGYKAGGYNTVNSLTPVIPRFGGTGPRDPNEFRYKKETLISYEIGTKNHFLNDRLEVNAAVYYQDWHDKQILELDAFGIVTAGNAERAHSYGLETDIRFEATEHLFITGGMRIGRSEYRDYVNDNGQQLKGKQVDFFSKFQGNLSATYYVPAFDDRLSVTGGIRYKSKHYFDPTNQLSQSGFALLDASVKYDLTDYASLKIWGKNLTDERYATYKFDDGRGAANSVTGTMGDGFKAGVSLTATY